MKSKKKVKKSSKNAGKKKVKTSRSGKKTALRKKAVQKTKKSVKRPKKKASKTVKKTTQKKQKSAGKKTVKKAVKKTVKKKTVLKKKKTVSKKMPVSKKKKEKVQKTKKSYLSVLEDELKSILEKTRRVSIKSPEGFTYCFEEDCDQIATTNGYCRYHYIAYWRQFKVKNKILSENKIQIWINQIIKNHSSKVLDYMIRDLSNEKDFSTALSDMKIDGR